MHSKAFTSGFIQKLAEEYGKLTPLEAIGQGAKFGIVAPLRIATAPLSIPLSILHSQTPYIEHEGLKNDFSRVLMAHFTPSLYAMNKRIDEIEAKDPELGKQVRLLIKNKLVKENSKGLTLAQLLTGKLTPPGMIEIAGGQKRFKEGLEGDGPTFWRRWLDPTGYSIKNLGYRIFEKSPELSRKILKTMESSNDNQ